MCRTAIKNVNWVCCVSIALSTNMLSATLHETGSYHRTETIAHTTFVCNVFFDGSEIIKEFTIDAQPVDQNTYQECKQQTGTLDLDHLKLVFEQRFMPFEQTRVQMSVQAALKLLRIVRDETSKLVRLLHEHALESFFVFKPETINSANFLQRIEKQLLPALQFCDDEQAKSEEYSTLKPLW